MAIEVAMSETSDGFRVDNYVLVRLLKPLHEGNREYRKTELQMSARVNYDTFLRYLVVMQKDKLVHVRQMEDGTELISITELGANAYNDLSRWNHGG